MVNFRLYAYYELPRLDHVLSYLESPEECELTEIIKNRGGPEKVMGDRTILRELFDSRLNEAGISGRSGPGRRGADGRVDEFKSLQEELQQGIQRTIAENMVQFQKEFDVRQSQLAEAVQSIVRRESDRVIAKVTGYGPHNKINDPVSRRSHQSSSLC